MRKLVDVRYPRLDKAINEMKIGKYVHVKTVDGLRQSLNS